MSYARESNQKSKTALANALRFGCLPTMLNNKRLVIAIDGPAASGKSTTAKLVADRLDYTYIDTGAMYRAVTLAVLRSGIDPDDQAAVERLASECTITLARSEDGSPTIYLNGDDVTNTIRSPEVTSTVSLVSSYAGVRERMVAMQQEMGAKGGVVLDGRDIGTVVFPDADVKVFMVADLHARAERRHAELERVGTSVDTIEAQLAERDRFDSSREVSPLRKADDAVLLDTSGLTIEEQVERVLELVREKLNQQS
jgi:cytidylate kinase